MPAGADHEVLTVVIFSGLAAAVSALGALPFAFRKRIPLTWEGSAYGVASGMMLGAGYLLISEALSRQPWSALAGAVVGVGLTYWSRSYSGIDQLSTKPGGPPGADHLAKTILQHALHSASEGVAIGVAMALNIRMGIFLALALAVHNIGEAMAMTSVLRRRGISVGSSAALTVVAKSTQVLLAVFAFAVAPALTVGLSSPLGFAAGALLFLVMTELLPASYQRSRKAAVASVVSLAAAFVVLLEDFFV